MTDQTLTTKHARFAQQLTLWMKGENLIDHQLARKLNQLEDMPPVTKSTIYKWRNGTTRPRPTAAAALLRCTDNCIKLTDIYPEFIEFVPKSALTNEALILLLAKTLLQFTCKSNPNIQLSADAINLMASTIAKLHHSDSSDPARIAEDLQQDVIRVLPPNK